MPLAHDAYREELVLEFPGLYDWQYAALASWRRHRRRGVIEAVTGTGKTRVGLAACHEALRQGLKVLILVPNGELQNQWILQVKQHVSWARVGRLDGSHKDSFRSVDVLVAIVHSASTQATLNKYGEGLLIADECHRYATSHFSAALSANYQRRLGLTATYQRQDHKNAELDRYFGGVIYKIWYPEALQAGIISAFDIAFVGVELAAGERRLYDEVSERITEDGHTLKKYLDEHGSGLDDMFHLEVAALADPKNSDPMGAVARRYQHAIARRQRLLAETPSKTAALHALLPAVEQATRALIFGHSQDAATLARGVMLQGGVSAEAVMSGMKKADRVKALEDFRSGRLKVLAAPKVLDEGVDVPEADLAVITSATRTERQTVQRLGRVIRRKRDGGIGRLAYLYVTASVEDPFTQDDFLPSVVPHARRRQKFFLPEATDDLLRFLTPERLLRGATTEAPGPSSPTRGTPVSGTDEPGEPGFVLSWAANDEPQARLMIAGASIDPVRDYKKKIGRHTLLNAEKEIEMAKRIESGVYAEHLLAVETGAGRRRRRELGELVRDGREAYEVMMTANLRLVVSLAKRFTGRGVLMLDLIQEGNIGLHQAVQKFDYREGTKFSTYATFWIRQALQRAMQTIRRPIRLPVHVEDKISRIAAARRALGGAVNDSRELAFMAKLEPDEVDELQRLESTKFFSLEYEHQTEHGPQALAELIALDGVDELDSFIESTTLRQSAHGLLDSLPQRQAEVLALRFGLVTGKEETLQSIGDRFGVSRERIRQLENKALVAARENADRVGYWPR